MPFADIKCIREVSSEDNNYPAENLMKTSANKWKTRTCGERVAFVVLELNKPQIINGFDIGNEHSAFIEVLVSNTSCNANDFTEILVTCSFMTLIESKNSTNDNRVRCFNKDALVPTAVSKKWQFIKVICSQPFNKHVQYGLSFIKIHVEGDQNKNVVSGERNIQIVTNNVTITTETLSYSKLGKFRLREESPESDSESSTLLFKRWKASEMKTDLRSSSMKIKNVKPSKECANTEKIDICLERNRKDLVFGSEDTSGAERLSMKRQKLLKAIENERQQLQNKVEKTMYTDSIKTNINSAKTNKKYENSQDKLISNLKNTCVEIVKNTNEKPDVFRPFNTLLKGTVLVISGIQNPDRADIRDKALSMGAKYRTDWGTGCTHLICAFKNTPKYNQVRGKGKIVTRAWIEECYKQKKCLPWRRFALDSTDLNQPESEEEVQDDSLRPIESSVTETKSKDKVLKVPVYNPSNTSLDNEFSSGSDTDDEIQRVLQNNTVKGTKTSIEKRNFDVSTEEEDFLDVKTKSVRNAKLN